MILHVVHSRLKIINIAKRCLERLSRLLVTGSDMITIIICPI